MPEKAATGTEKRREPTHPQKSNTGADIINRLRHEKTQLRLHLTTEVIIQGKIEQSDPYNLVVRGDNDKHYWIPKHTVVYAELP